MATKEELNRIFEEALQEEEAVFKSPAPAATPASTVSTAMPVAAPILEPVMEQAATAPQAEVSASDLAKPNEHASVNETDPEFGALLEEREGRLKKRNTRVRWAVNLLLLGIFGGTATAFTVSPTLRGKLDRFVVSLQEGVDDVKMMSKGSENYDEALGEVAERGNQVEAASRAMGIDPTTIDSGDDPNMLAEMNALAGEDLGTDSRLGKLQTMGKIGQSVTGAEGPKSKEDFAKEAQVAAEAPAQ